LPTNFDANYCYALGYAAGALLHSGKTGLISSVCVFMFFFHMYTVIACFFFLLNLSIVFFLGLFKFVLFSIQQSAEHHNPMSFTDSEYQLQIQVGNLAAPVEEWTVGGTALTSLMDVERRHGMLQLVLFIINYFIPN